MAESGKGVIGILDGDFTLGLGQLGAQAIGVADALDRDLRHRLRSSSRSRTPITKGGIRPTADDEIDGLDLPEMGALAYPEFEFAIEHVGSGDRRAGARRLRPRERPPGRAVTGLILHHPTAITGRARLDRARPVRARPDHTEHRRMDIAEILRHILIVLVAAKVAAEVAERIGIPAVVGEIVAGILIGPSVLNAVGEGDEVLRTLGEIGVILLLLDVGPGDGPRRAGQGRAHVAARSPPSAWSRRWSSGLGAMSADGRGLQHRAVRRRRAHRHERRASPPGCSATSARSPPTRPASCWARRSPTT